MKKDAVISKDNKYRYLLSRTWDDSKPIVAFIGLNPSIADDKIDDPTVNRCINFAKSWGYGGFYMLNLFAFRATEPKNMFKAESPIGDENDKYILKYSKQVDKVVCAWGNHGKYKERSTYIFNLINNTYYLKMNKSGEPAHPLYLKANLTPIQYKELR